MLSFCCCPRTPLQQHPSQVIGTPDFRSLRVIKSLLELALVDPTSPIFSDLALERGEGHLALACKVVLEGGILDCAEDAELHVHVPSLLLMLVACKLDIIVIVIAIIVATTGIHPVAMMLVAIKGRDRDRVEDAANRNGRGFISISLTTIINTQ
jgi:hypothetical protein